MIHFWWRMRADNSAGDLYETDEERRRAIRYSRTKEWLVLAGMLWSSLFAWLALVTGSSARLRDRAGRLAPEKIGPVIPYSLGATLATSLMSLPLSYLGGYVVEHRFGLSNQSRRAWIIDQLKGVAIGMTLIVPIAQGAFWIIRRYPQRWWAVLSGLTIPFTIVLSNLAPVLLLPLFNRFEPLRDRAMAKRLEDLAESQGVHVSDVMQMDMSRQTKKANAFFTGVGNTKRIILGDTLLDEFTSDEVEIVLAHELGHQVHRDIWKLIGLGAVTSLLNFYAVHRLSGPFIRRFGSRWGIASEQGAADVAALPLFTLIGGGISLLTTPLLNALIRGSVEHPADRYALDLTGKQDAFVGAMQKLGRMNLSDPEPPALVKHMLYDHPPLQERIDFGLNYVPQR